MMPDITFISVGTVAGEKQATHKHIILSNYQQKEEGLSQTVEHVKYYSEAFSVALWNIYYILQYYILAPGPAP